MKNTSKAIINDKKGFVLSLDQEIVKKCSEFASTKECNLDTLIERALKAYLSNKTTEDDLAM